MLLRIIACLLICSLAMTSCTAKKRTTSRKNKPKTERVISTKESTPRVKVGETNPPKSNSSYSEIVRSYIDKYKTIAKEEMLQYGIPASITLAQGILESGAGRGELTGKANNHFGIKCHKGWTGERVYHDDDKAKECFRKYKDPKYSFRDHSLFLTGRSRYQDLFKLKKDDYRGWAKGLKKAGYATDPKYPAKLISIIERYDLEAYDKDVLGNTINLAQRDESKISTYSVKKGDTLYSISRMHNIAVDTLKEYNGLRSNEIAIGQLLYLHPRKN